MKKGHLLLATTTIMMSYCVSPIVAVAENYESQINQNKQQIEQNNQKLQNLNSQKTQQQEQLDALIQQMSSTQQEIDDLTSQIQKTQDQIINLQREIDDLNDKIEKRATKIDEQARHLQTESTASDYITALFSSESIVEAFQKMFTMAQITGASQDILVQQQHDKESVETKKAELDQQLVSQGERASKLQQLSQEQDAQKANIESTITQIQSNVDLASAQNSALQNDIQRAQQKLEEYRAKVAEQQRIEQQNRLAQQQQEEANRRAAFIQSRQHNTSTSNTQTTSTTTNHVSTNISNVVTTPVATTPTVTSYVSGSGNFPAPSPSFIARNNGGYPGQCTWYIYNRLAQLGVNIPYRVMGNGGQWGAYARSYGYSVSSTPKAGRVVSFQGGEAGSSSYGHVAFVETVNADGSIVVSEMNVRGPFVISTRTLSSSVAAQGDYIDFGL